MEDLKSFLQKPEYDFLRNDPRLNKQIILLTLGGSHAYGTQVETSDVDVRGVAMNSLTELFSGRRTFEQVVEPKTDTTIYSLLKFTELLRHANPNMFEILGCRPCDTLVLHPVGQELIDHVDLFLSKRVGRSFAGYASMQLTRLLNKSSHLQSQEEKEKHILQSMHRAMDNLYSQLRLDRNQFHFYIDKATTEDLSTEIFMDVQAQHLPVRDFNRVLKTSRQVVLDFDKMGFRNVKAYQHNKINKHMMHLIRLMYMGIEILETHQVHTYREKEHGLLMAIRNGKYTDANEQPTQAFFQLHEELSQRLDESIRHSTLPDEVDQDAIDAFVTQINQTYFK